MCESTVWLRHPNGHTEKIADSVLIAIQDGNAVVLRGLLAGPRRVLGTIHEIDSFKHTITVLATESSDVSAQPQDKC
jgi:predicted RNA-binding protein